MERRTRLARNNSDKNGDRTRVIARERWNETRKGDGIRRAERRGGARIEKEVECK